MALDGLISQNQKHNKNSSKTDEKLVSKLKLKAIRRNYVSKLNICNYDVLLSTIKSSLSIHNILMSRVFFANYR